MGKKRLKKKHLKKEYNVSSLNNIDELGCIKEGRSAFDEGDYRKATAKWSLALKVNPSSTIRKPLAEAHFRYGLNLYGSNTPADVNPIISALSKAVNLVSNIPIYLYHLGLTYLKSKRYNQAFKALQKAYILDPANERFLLHLNLVKVLIDRDTDIIDENKLQDYKSNKYLILLSLFKHNEWKRINNLINMVLDRTPEDSHDEIARLSSIGGLSSIMLNDPIAGKNYLFKSYSILHDNLLISYYYGLSLALNKDYRGAVTIWERLIDSGLPHLSDLRPNLVKAYKGIVISSNNTEERINICKKILMLYPEDRWSKEVMFSLYFRKASEKVKQDRFDEAISLWKEAIKISDEKIEPYHNIALAFETQENLDEANMYWKIAREKLKKSIRKEKDRDISKQISFIHKRIADNFSKTGDFSNALNEFEKALIYDPNSVELRKTIAELCLLDGKFANAKKHYEFINSMPGNEDIPEVITNLGIAYLRSNNIKKGIYYFKKAINSDDSNYAKKALSLEFRDIVCDFVCRKIGSKRETGDFMNEVTEIAGDEPMAKASCGSLYMRWNMNKEAKKSFRDAANLSSDNPDILIHIVHCSMTLGRESICNEYTKRVERDFSDDPFVMIRLAQIYLHNRYHYKYMKKGKRIINRVAKEAKESEDIKLLEDISKLLAKVGEHNKAIECLKICIRKEPSNHIPHIGLALVYLEKNDLKSFSSEIKVIKELAKKNNDINTLNFLNRIGKTFDI
ncbi:MAG: tetratricopeptide repeat protein [Nitrospinota bacterium]